MLQRDGAVIVVVDRRYDAALLGVLDGDWKEWADEEMAIDFMSDLEWKVNERRRSFFSTVEASHFDGRALDEEQHCISEEGISNPLLLR